MTYEELRQAAIQELKDDDSLFTEMVDELDSWNGFANGFRAFPMDSIDDLFYGCTPSEFLDKLAPGFNYQDDYMIDTIYGIDSCDDLTEHYRNNVWEAELLDNLLDNIDNIDFWNHEDFKETLEQLAALNVA